MVISQGSIERQGGGYAISHTGAIQTILRGGPPEFGTVTRVRESLPRVV